jgi:hypothetical protein
LQQFATTFPILNWLHNEKRLIYSSLLANVASVVGNDAGTDVSRQIERLSAEKGSRRRRSLLALQHNF